MFDPDSADILFYQRLLPSEDHDLHLVAREVSSRGWTVRTDSSDGEFEHARDVILGSRKQIELTGAVLKWRRQDTKRQCPEAGHSLTPGA